MPFTLAHPVIVLPLKNKYFSRYFSLTALVIGSMFPDFEYFIRMTLKSIYSHTVLGIFLFNLPLGLLFCFIFHNIIRDELFNNAPHFLRVRLNVYRGFNWNNYFLKNPIIIIVSLIIGSFSHILWDSFTHFNGYFVEKIGFLNYSVIISNISIPVYKILQHSGSIIGCLIIFILIMKLEKNDNLNKINIWYWVFVFLVISIIFLIKIINGLNFKLYGNVIVIFISSALIALILVPIILKIIMVISKN
ncbi:MAG: DUF4184 family protein [Treponema sp.]|nr:DUF4184 family protein [Treponema sp.]